MKWRFLILISLIHSLNSQAECVGKFVNPITDICWGCVLPITIGGDKVGIKIKKYSGAKGRDIPNPSTPVCYCSNPPRVGVPIGFWEPVRMIEVTRTPFCMVGLGGVQFGEKPEKISGPGTIYNHSSFYHLHYYTYPLIYWLEVITDFLCLEKGAFDVAYMSEFDPTWNDSAVANLMNPESLLFGNIAAQAACSIDCVAANTNMPLDSMSWCAGCIGNMYPWMGYNGDHYGGVQSSNLLAIRGIAKMHRIGLSKSTSTTDGSLNGPLCKKHFAPIIKKSQYKLQMVYPKFVQDSFCCHPLGMTDLLHGSGKEFPITGEDFIYILWRKANCCLL